jgi:hypothetical protein
VISLVDDDSDTSENFRIHRYEGRLGTSFHAVTSLLRERDVARARDVRQSLSTLARGLLRTVLAVLSISKR